MNLFNHTEKSTKSANTKPLFSSLSTFGPYMMRYRWLFIFAFLALSVAALVTLALPVAIRQMLDHGFSSSSRGNINFYFGILFVLA
ncbi:MAG: ABC transporter, partial [Bartonella sp.]|nr:ABC transporter [Bartonella sp.]